MHKEVGIYFVPPAKQGQQVKCQGKFMIRILWIAIANVKCATGDGNVNKWNNKKGVLVGGEETLLSPVLKIGSWGNEITNVVLKMFLELSFKGWKSKLNILITYCKYLGILG